MIAPICLLIELSVICLESGETENGSKSSGLLANFGLLPNQGVAGGVVLAAQKESGSKILPPVSLRAGNQ